MLESAALARQFSGALEADWRNFARPNQLPPAGDWSVWIMKAGRGWGKTVAGANFVRDCVEAGLARHIAIVGATAADVRDVCIEGPSGLLAISPGWNRPVYEPSKRRVTWPNGATATLFSSEEPDRLRGPNHDLAWCDELCSWSNMAETWSMLMLTLRVGKRPRCCVTTTPRPSKLLKELLSRPDVFVTGGPTLENAANLAPDFLARITAKYHGTRLGRQELNAELLEDVEGALWNRAMIDDLRIEPGKVPALRRIVVAIDPAVSCSPDSDETGIVVAGIGGDGICYVLEDASGRFQPGEWARRAIGLYHRHKADRIIAEINQGGQLVEQTIRTIDANVPYRGVHAKRGKIVRAEPISALYEQRRVRHAGVFEQLEDQLCTYAGGGDSPDRLDALVYAIAELALAAPNDGIIEATRRMAEEARRGMAPSASVRLQVPAGISTVYVLSGKCHTVGDDRIIEVAGDDAPPLRIAGFVEEGMLQ